MLNELVGKRTRRTAMLNIGATMSVGSRGLKTVGRVQTCRRLIA